MDEKQLQALYDAMRSSLDLGDYNNFKNTIVKDTAFRKAFYQQASTELDLGDYNTFNKNIGFDSQEVKQQKQPAIPGFMDIGGQTQQTIQTAQQNIPKVQQQPITKPKQETGVFDVSVIGQEVKPTAPVNKGGLPIGVAVEQDKKIGGSTVGAIYNTLVDLFSEVGGGAAYVEQYNPLKVFAKSLKSKIDIALTPGAKPSDVLSGDLIKMPEPDKKREQAYEFVQKARSSSSTKEQEQERAAFDITDGLSGKDIEAFLFNIPKQLGGIGLGAGTGGLTWVLQSINDNAAELAANPNAKDLTNTEKNGYILGQALTQAAFEKFSLGLIFKSTGLSKAAQRKVLSEVMDEFASKGKKATAKELEDAIFKKTSQFASKAKRVGLGTATGFVVEGTTEGTQTIAGESLKLLLNKIKGKEIFNEEDIEKNFFKNLSNSIAMGSAMGGPLGGLTAGFQNTNKSIRRQIAEANKPEDLQKVADDINAQVQEGNLSPQEAEQILTKAQEYTDIASKIPPETDTETKYSVIGGIEQRKQLENEIQKLEQEIQNVDPAFAKQKQDQLDLLKDKLSEVNDYIQEVVTGERNEYIEKDGKYIKITPDGSEVEITKGHYELSKAAQNETKRKAQSTVIMPGRLKQSDVTTTTQVEAKPETKKSTTTIILPKQNEIQETQIIQPKADEGTIAETESIEGGLPESQGEVKPITTETESSTETKPIEPIQEEPKSQPIEQPEQQTQQTTVSETLTFTTSNNEQVSGERLSKALNKVADYWAEMSRKIREEDNYASQVTEKQKDEELNKGLERAEQIRRGENIDNFTIWQRVNQELTGESVPLFSDKANQHTVSNPQPIKEEVSITTEPETQPQEPIIAETKETTIKEQQGKVDTGAKKDLSTRAREYADKLLSGEETVLPDWLQASLPKGTKKQGISINEAFAQALKAFADAYDATKNFAQAVDEGFQKIKDWFEENKIPYNEAELKEKFAQDRQGEIPSESQPPPPSEPPVSEQGEGKGGSVVYKMRSLQRNLINRATGLTEEQKRIAKVDTNAMYAVLPKAQSKKIAEQLIKEIGVDEAVKLAENKGNELAESERVMLLGEAMNYYAGEAKKAAAKGDIANEKSNADYELLMNEKYEKAVKSLGELGTEYGRAINLFNEIYKLSNIALSRKLQARTEKLNKLRAKDANQKVEGILEIINNEEKQVEGIGEQLTEKEAAINADVNEEIKTLKKEIEDLKKQVQENTGQFKGTKSNPLNINRKTNDTEYDRRLKEFRSRHRTGLNKDDLSDLTYFGLYHIENGITKFAEWYDSMSKKFGKFKEHLADVYDKVKEDAVSNGVDENLFSSENDINNFFNGVKAKAEYKTLETERNRQLALVEKLKEKLAKLEKEGLPKKEQTESEKDVPEIEALKQKVSDLQESLRKKESDVKKTEDNIAKLNEELQRIRERRKKEPKKTSQQAKQYSDEEKAIIEQIKAEKEKWDNEKKAAIQAKRDYAKMETERNRQIKKYEDLKAKLEGLKQGKRPEPKESERKLDTPEIEDIKAQIKTESEKLSNIEKQQKRIEDLETELQRLIDRKPKDKKETTSKEISDREKELLKQIEAEKEKIRKEYKESPEYQAESDAKKMAQLTKRQAIAELNKAMANNPERARVLAPRYAAKRIREDAAKNLDMPTTKDEQTYLKKLINAVVNKAKEYYGEQKEKVVNVNDWLQFAIANGKKDYKIWERTQEELNRQIDADNNLNDTQKQEVRDFLKDYTDSIFETLLTKTQKRTIINQKLIDAGFVIERVVNGKETKQVDWAKIIGNKKTIKEAKDAIVKSITDLGFTEAEAQNEINALLDSFDSIVADKLTKDTNAFLNKSVIDKAKGFFGKGVGKSKIQRLVDLKNKGILDVAKARKVLSDQLGIYEVSEADYNRVKELLDKIDTPNLPVFVRKKFEEEIQYIFDKYGGNIQYLKHRDFALSNALTSPVQFAQNITGLYRIPSKALVTAIKTGNFKTVGSIVLRELRKSKDIAKTVAAGDISRGTAYDEFTMDIEGNPRVRYNEYGETKLLGIPDAYTNVGNKIVNLNILNEGMKATSRAVGRGYESVDTFASNPIAALQMYEDLRRFVKKIHPEYSNKKINSVVYDLMYSEDILKQKELARKAMIEAGVEPTEERLNRAAYEAIERMVNDKVAKEFYATVEKTLPAAEERLKNRGVKDPTKEQIEKEAFLIIGVDTPPDVIASAEREAQRLTGKKSTVGLTSIILSPVNWITTGAKKNVTKEHSVAGRAVYNTLDAATQTVFPYANSIGRWIEFGLEFTPYGLGKGLIYKAFKGNLARLENVSEAEINRMGNDFLIRSIQGAAQTILGFWLLGLANEGEDEPEELVSGTYQEENYNKEKVSKIGQPKRSMKLFGNNVPIDLLGIQAVPMIMWSDFLKRRKDPSYDEKHDLLYMSVAIYFDAVSQAYQSFDQRYGGMVSNLQKGKDEKALQSLGTVAGQVAGKYLVPFNRMQNDIAQLANPLSQQSIDFGTNALQQLSIVKGFSEGKPNYDYRGRTVDIGDIYSMSADGFAKMFQKPKYGDEIDSFLATIDFAATDAYREGRMGELPAYKIYESDGTPREMTPDEYYDFKYETGKKFDELLKQSIGEIRNINVDNAEGGGIDARGTAEQQRQVVSSLLTSSKQIAQSIIQEKVSNQ